MSGRPGAVVEQGVDVEGREHARAVRGHEVLAGQALGGAGVDEAVEGLDEDDVLEDREVGGEVVQLARVACHAGSSARGAVGGTLARRGRVHRTPRAGALVTAVTRLGHEPQRRHHAP
jgi:hypothetical protein